MKSELALLVVGLNALYDSIYSDAEYGAGAGVWVGGVGGNTVVVVDEFGVYCGVWCGGTLGCCGSDIDGRIEGFTAIVDVAGFEIEVVEVEVEIDDGIEGFTVIVEVAGLELGVAEFEVA